MRIAIFGGSFNPPHKGHLNSALYAAQQLRPDKFLIIPDAQPPHKDLAENSPTPRQRMSLCRLNFATLPNAEVSDIEIRRGGKSYTADTLRALRETYPDAELVLLVGTDMFLTLEQWYDAEYIMQQAIIAPFQRGAQELELLLAKAAELKSSFGACVELIRMIRLIRAHEQEQVRKGKRLHITDERFLKEAEKMVCEELSLVLDISRDEVLQRILQ